MNELGELIMSAITGIFYRDGRTVSEKQIQKMNDRLSHRGPDGSLVWCEGPVALGHQMLHTTPESLHESLPYEEDGLVITADARIDNRKELSSELGIEDKEEISDSYFILKAYQKWGEKCPEELLGDFAFAIWDKDKEQLFCARDHMGVKPFYYYLSDEAFFFASEIKAISLFQEIPKKLNEFKLALFLTIILSDKINTFYEGIVKLAPAHYLSVDEDLFKSINYWELDPDYQIKMDSDEEYFELFIDIFSEAIKCRMRSAFPVGFELSGGLDSSSIVCMARKLVNKNNSDIKKIKTYSYVFDEFPTVDERFYINKVLDGRGIEHCFCYGDNITPLDQIDEILSFQEQPFYTPNMPILWKERQKMNEDNIRVLLTGDGGDELMHIGNIFLQELAFTFQWKKLFEEIFAFSKNKGYNLHNLFLIYFIFPFIPETIRNFFSRKKKDMFAENGTIILNQDLINRIGGKEYLRNLKRERKKRMNNTKKYHYFTLNLDHYVLEMHDKTSAAFSMEQRYPYFDKRLVEFSYSLPSEMKFKEGWNRFVQRFAMNGILPPEIQLRTTKGNFNPIYEQYLLKNEEIVENILGTDLIGDYIDLDKIREIYQQFKSGIKEGNDIFGVWLSLLLFKWFKKEEF